MKNTFIKKLILGSSITTIAILALVGILALALIGMISTLFSAAAGNEAIIKSTTYGSDLVNGNTLSVVDHALTFMGTPYVLGGASYTSIDCSGLVKMSYWGAKTNLSIPHASYEQAKLGSAVYGPGYTLQVIPTTETILELQGYGEYTIISLSPDGYEQCLEPGDIICFGYGGATKAGHAVGHVGIYIGNGWYIHALNTTKRTHISPLYTVSANGTINFTTSIYTIRRYAVPELSTFGESQLFGHPTYIYYEDYDNLELYIASLQEDLTTMEKYNAAVALINQSRAENTSITNLISGLGITNKSIDEISARIARCAVVGMYYSPIDSTEAKSEQLA